MYQAARKTVMGDFKTLANRRADAMKAFIALGVTEAQVFAKLEVSGIEDIGLEHLVVLRGLITAIKDGDTTPEQAFDAAPAGEQKKKEAPAAYSQADFNKNLPAWRKLIADGKKTADQIIAMAGSKALLTEEQIATLKSDPAANQSEADKLIEKMRKAGDVDALDAHADLIATLPEADRENATAIYKSRRSELNK
jgi:hypothetical protein